MTNICECCGRCDTEHIGKSSYGWQFSFHATDKAKSFVDWKRILTDGIIHNEYGEEMSLEKFIAFVEDKQRDWSMNHAAQYPHDKYEWVDDDGYSFTDREFT